MLHRLFAHRLTFFVILECYSNVDYFYSKKKSKIAQNLHKYIVINPKKNKISKNA
jgi:hypothetical protein